MFQKSLSENQQNGVHQQNVRQNDREDCEKYAARPELFLVFPLVLTH